MFRSLDHNENRPIAPMSYRYPKAVFLNLAFFLCLSSSYAHRGPRALTTIEQNQNTGTIEIVHRLHLQDAEDAIRKIYSEKDLTLETIEGRAQLALHVEGTFQVVDGETDKPISLSLVGAQIEGDIILVFQEHTDVLPKLLKIRHDALRETFPQQVNTVNIRLGSYVRTLVFRENKWKTVKR